MSHTGPSRATALAGSWALPSKGPLVVCTVLASWPPGTSLLFRRAGERPELCRVSLPEFQQFLLEYQGVWLAWDRVGCLPAGGRAHL